MSNDKLTFYEFLEKEFADIDVYCGINKLSHYDSAKLTWDFVESQKNQEIEELRKENESLKKKLEKAEEVVKFYGDPEKWLSFMVILKMDDQNF